jgi:hypothetical protein
MYGATLYNLLMNKSTSVGDDRLRKSPSTDRGLAGGQSAMAEDEKPMKEQEPLPPTQAIAGYQDSEFAFPFRVYSMLEDATKLDFEAIVSWVQGGAAFVVHDRDEFTKRIMPLYFDQTLFKSFQRQLNFYQFERVLLSGPNRGKFLRLGKYLASSLPKDLKPLIVNVHHPS